MTRLSEIELCNPMGFSAGHFTIFSATHRENLHGHNYVVHCAVTTQVSNLGITFDYRVYNVMIEKICQSLQQAFLLPTQCPFLTIEESDELVFAHFNGEKIPFLKRDVVLLPLKNITVEELSHWFLTQLVDQAPLQEHAIQKIVMKVSSSPGRFGSATWEKL